jgi:hypothetical protein
MAAFRSRHRRGGRWWLAGVTAAAAAAVGVFLVVGASGAPLTGSTFDTSNGSLTSTTNHDWNPAGSPLNNVGPLQAINCGTTIPGAPLNGNCALDWVNSSSDNSFGQGTKEDSTSPTVVTGQIPTNKDDLSRFYINKQTANVANCGGTGVNTCHLLYLAWERTNLLGSAHLDFEFNQADPGISNSSTGSVNLNRTAGDILIDFDFGGSGVPVLTLHFWLTTGGVSKNGQATDCQASTTYPCWGTGTTLNPNVAQASVNSGNVVDYNGPNAPNTLAGSTSSNGTISSTFGEAAINLEAAGVFNPNKCESLGFGWVKSRSAGSSFDSEMKDFIAPLKTSVNNCGSLLIYKTDGTNGLAGATFTATPGSTDTSGTTATSSTFVDEGTTSGNSALNGYYCLDNMKLNQSTLVHESVAPAGYNAAADQTITVTNSASCATRLAAQSITADGSTFVDTPQVGAIQITKTGKDKNCTGTGTSSSGTDLTCTANKTRLLNGAVFQLKTGSTVNYTSNATSGTGSSAGVTCLDNVTPGQYTLHESTTPSGYQAATDSSVTIAANTSCAGTGNSAPLAVGVFDQPLTTITVNTTPEITGATTSTVQCTPTAATGDTNPVTIPPSHTTNAVIPGTYVCTVSIDP